MDVADRERLINRITSGLLKYRGRAFGSIPLFIGPVSIKDRYIADEIYHSVYNKSLRSRVYSDEELYEFLIQSGLWSTEEEDRMPRLLEDMDNLKVTIYESHLDFNKQSAARIALIETKQLYEKLAIRRHSYDYMSASGVANLAKSRYLALMALQTPNGKKLFKNKWRSHIDESDDVLSFIAQNRISEASFREIARTEPWRSLYIWKPLRRPLNWTEDQKNLMNWSKLYEWILKNPKKPSEEVINDDDNLDGWLILQRRQANVNENKQRLEDMIPPKMRNAQEVFIKANTLEDVRRINELNSPQAKRIKKQRADAIRKHGEIRDIDLPDVAQRLRLEAAQAIANRNK